jgi:2-haloacid dehalogenase
MTTLDPAAIRYLTFDCYGTLVDWESGILAALRPVLEAHHTPLDDEALLALYSEVEPEVESAGDFIPYREVLRRVVAVIGERLGWRPDADEAEVLVETLPDWPLFPEVGGALGRLADRYGLVVVSNVDDALFDATAARIGVPFHEVVTAEQVGVYKPHPVVFDQVLRRLGADRSEVLHVAQSLFHDIAPARSVGLRTVWVDRRGGRSGGATPASEVRPDHRVEDLEGLCRLLEMG